MSPPDEDDPSRTVPPTEPGATESLTHVDPAPDPERTTDLSPAPPGSEKAPNDPTRVGPATDFEPTGFDVDDIAAPPQQPSARRFGSYEMLEKVAEGGMGVVYKARQLNTGRVVALKLIRRGSFARPADVERFRVETRAAAALDHPGIVPIYDVGEAGGQPYYTMAYVGGGSLQQLLAGGPLPPRVAAGLVRQLAEAVQYAHEHGVIHRDIKPHNVLLQRGEAPAPGATVAAVRPPAGGSAGSGTGTAAGIPQPRLADFGLARLVEGEGGVSVTGEALGTPSYMPPEQASGDRPRVGRATDVYSLGAVLYCCLTGRPPFQSANQLETLRQVREEEPLPPRRVNPAVPDELQTVCLKCLEKEPARRYASAAALAEDLRRYWDDEPILAVPAGPLTRAAKWAHRRPAVAGLLAAVALVSSLGAVGVTWAYGRALREAENAREALAAAQEANHRRVRVQVEQLRTAAAPAVPALLKALDAERAEALPDLRELWRSAGDKPGRMRFALALLPDDPSLRDDVAAAMLGAKDPHEALLLLDGLKPFAADLKEGLWQRAGDKATSAEARFRALVALAALDPADARWQSAGRAAVEQLLKSNSLYLGEWSNALRPASAALLGPLGEVFRGKVQADKRQVAAEVLADYARDDPAALVDLALDSDPQQFALLSPLLAHYRNQSVALLGEAVARRASDGTSETERNSLARQQASAAAALLLLGDAKAAWPVLRHTPAPDARSHLVRDLSPRGVEATVLAKRLDEETDASARRALILALGEYTPEQLPAELRSALVPKLLAWYRGDPDPGVHGAVDWLLRHGKEGPAPRKFDWGQEEALAAVDRELAGRPAPGGQGWYVAPGGFTMTVVNGSVEFWMGSPATESGHFDDEARHRRRIGRRFAVATKAVTVAQFQEFLKAKPPGVPAGRSESSSPEPECPINGADWFTAAKFCRWLSEREGVAEDQMCYPPMKDIKEGMKPYPDYLRRTGYRLPSEAEWEYLCRAGAETSYSFGADAELLPRYAWFVQNSANRTWPVGQKRPNDLGLFDTHGNAWTWCQDSARDYPPGTADKPAEDKEDLQDLNDSASRIVRGGGFSNLPALVRCSCRSVIRPSNRVITVGLRVARTCP